MRTLQYSPVNYSLNVSIIDTNYIDVMPQRRFTIIGIIGDELLGIIGGELLGTGHRKSLIYL